MYKSVALFGIVMMLFAMPLSLRAQDEEEAAVYVIEGSKGSISQKDTARIEAGGIAGTSVEAVIEGPAKLKRANVMVTKDGQMLIGATKVELNVLPTGAGVVTVKVVTKSPTNPNSETRIYKITVK